MTGKKSPAATVLSLAHFLEQHPPHLAPASSNRTVAPAGDSVRRWRTQSGQVSGRQPRFGSASGSPRIGFSIPSPRQCARLSVRTSCPAVCRPPGTNTGPLGSKSTNRYSRGWPSAQRAARMSHSFSAAQSVPPKSSWTRFQLTHDRTKTIPEPWRLCASRCCVCAMLREPLLSWCVVCRKSITRYEREIGSAFRGSSALHAVGDSYMLLTRPSPQLTTVELRFQFRYAAAQPPRLLQLDPLTLWFCSTNQPSVADFRGAKWKRRRQALAGLGQQARYGQLWTGPNVPSAPLNWPSARLASKAGSSRKTASTACGFSFHASATSGLRQTAHSDRSRAGALCTWPAGPPLLYPACPLPPYLAAKSTDFGSIFRSRCGPAIPHLASRRGGLGGHVIDLVAILGRCSWQPVCNCKAPF